MSKFIATGALNTNEGKNVDRTIYGVGDTPEAAIADARTWGATGELTVTACTKALADAVIKRGGDIEWKLVDAVADLPAGE